MGCCASNPNSGGDNFDGVGAGSAGPTPVPMTGLEKGLEVANESRIELALQNRPSGRLVRGPAKDPSFRAKKFPKSIEERAIISSALQSNFLFNSLTPGILADCVDSFQRQDAAANTMVIQQGDTDVTKQAFFIIEDGTCEVVVDGVKVTEMMSGNSFGEMSLLYKKPRSATIRTAGVCKLWHLDRPTFEQSLAAAVNSDLNQTETILRKVPLLKVLSNEQFKTMAEAAQYISYPAGQKIIEKGTVGNIFYVIKSGDVVCKDLSDNKTEVHLHAGDFVGERALLTQEPRSGNVYAATDVEVVAVDRDTFQGLMGTLQSVLNRNLSMRVLRSMDLLETLSDNELIQLSGALVERSYKSGEYIIKQFDKGSEFFIIKDGTVCVTVNDKNKMRKHASISNIMAGGKNANEKQVDTMGVNDYFGEMALIEDEQRSANIVADTEVHCLVLDKVNFARLLGPSRMKMTREAITRKVNKASHLTNVTMKDVDTVSVLGTGNYSVVKLVKHKQTKDTMAVKVMSKVALAAKGQADNIVLEKNMLKITNHPFIMKLIATSQDAMQIYMFTEVCMGGELFSYLHESKTRQTDSIPSSEAIFFAACVLEALEHMHSRGIVYRDLKPENVLLDQDGYCKLVDFGFARRLDTRLFTICGTMEYLAPEVLLRKGYGKGCDYWGLGILIFEMVVGDTPWADKRDELQQAEAICKGFSAHDIPKFIRDSKCKDIMRALCNKDPAKRLGCMKNGAGDVKNHPWFASMDWGALLSKDIRAPWVPPMRSTDDVSNFPEQDQLLTSFNQFDVEIPVRDHRIVFKPTGSSKVGLQVQSVGDEMLATKIPNGAYLLSCNVKNLTKTKTDAEAQAAIRTASRGRSNVFLKFEVTENVMGSSNGPWSRSFEGW
jgi:cGMP-dependent protein kinase